MYEAKVPAENRLRADIATRETQINRAMTELSCALENLDRSVSCLEDRLCCVLRDEPPAIAGGAKIAEQQVPLANAIKMKADEFSGLASKLDEIRERCEL